MGILLCCGRTAASTLREKALSLAALWNRTPTALTRHTFFNDQESSLHQYIVAAPVLILSLVARAVFPEDTALLVLAGLGLCGLVLVPLWTSSFSNIFQRRRYVLAAGFRPSE